MPYQIQVQETYWCPGRWPWQWFRTCKRTVTQWCYQFQWVKENRWGFGCSLEGCENGIRYTWSAWCFNLFGSETYYNVEKCFGTQRTESGTCR